MIHQQIIRMIAVFIFAFSSVQLLPWPIWAVVLFSWLFGNVVAWTHHVEYVREIERLFDKMADDIAEQEALARQKSRRGNKR